MQIHGYGETDVGRSRSHNEDHILVEPALGLFVVCDGMGGHAAGEVASETAAKAVHRHVASQSHVLSGFDGSSEACEAVEAVLRTAIQSASAEVFDLARAGQGRHGMGTTCIALIVVGGKGFMGHVGDSRMYMVRGGRVWQLSQDHTFFNDAVRNGMMSFEEARSSPWANMVTRGVGIQRSVAVDTLVFDVVANDTLLLCSDGLTAYLQEHHEIASVLSDPALPGLPKKLVRLANERGGGDNISAIVVRGVTEMPTHSDDDARRIKVTQNLQTLRHIALFMDLGDPEIVRLFNKFQAFEHPPGAVIIKEGDDTDSMFVIVEGDVQIVRAGKVVATLTRGAHFGEMGLLNQRPRSATVTVTSPTQILVLERRAFNEVLREDTGLAAKLLYKLAQILSLRLDESFQGDATEHAERKTLELGVLSPFRPRW
ncbi:cyclic nucleotide-binding domain-containing protein [Enhygromyxa salina]|uniref:Serine/threonine phosphatase stp n=1 Tax=Enhygromyxa salina TaxID=215803 RepID=A0A2S9Y1P5_9BACT|nr:cyclic nucleotide-binding domain-containing protein [Enhygromyxa salina]PRP99032.1 Serine/threonine phosphatase stp [Enhygromyxa salina]